VGAQPTIQWQRCYGGTFYEEPFDIQSTIDGGSIVVGVTLSANGDVQSNFGGGDIWVIKLDSLGQLEWEVNLGGSNEDTGYSILLRDEGFLISGFTNSDDGQVLGNHGKADGWIVLLDNQGSIMWRKCYGGSNSEKIFSSCRSSDGGFLFASESLSSDGDVPSNQGSADIWIFKIDQQGQLIWSKTYGGSNLDIPHKIVEREDGRIYVLGETSSDDGNVSLLKGAADVWLLVLDSLGDLIWQKTFGGSAIDYGVDIDWLNDGTLILAANTYSSNGDVTDHHGSSDFWIAGIGDTGDLLWQKTFGGSGEDWVLSLEIVSDSVTLFFGSTQSNNGDIAGNDGGQDYWLVGVSNDGTLLWQQTYGGTMAELGHDLEVSADGGVTLIGRTRSNNGDVSGNNGSSDFWIVKLFPETSSTSTPTAIPLNLYPNPASNWITLNLPITEANMQVSITDELGKLVLSRTIRTDEKLDISTLEPGVYWVSAVSVSGQVYAGKFVKAID
jgi:hypothetical protein